MAKLIQARRAGFKTDAGSVERGHAIFAKRCTACHQVGTEGKKIGPQLDGIGVRGLDRLSEDMLDPNRNVDAAFRSSTLALVDGRVVTGLKRREEGTDLVLADQEGKEFRVPLADIDDNKLSSISLMPANFGEQVPQEEFNDLMAWLLNQRPK
jgi:putative heme-binding domain-containing protein